METAAIYTPDRGVQVGEEVIMANLDTWTTSGITDPQRYYRIDMTRALIFRDKGRSSWNGQRPSAAFPDARFVFEEVDDALEQKLSKIMFEGPEQELTLTENAAGIDGHERSPNPGPGKTSRV